MTALLSANTTFSLLSLTSNTLLPLVASSSMATPGGPMDVRRYIFSSHSESADDSHRRRRHSKRNEGRKRKRLTAADGQGLSDSHPSYQDASLPLRVRKGGLDSSWAEEHQRLILGFGEDETKKRRSINSPVPGRPKEAQLYNVNRRSVVEVHRNGSVSTTERTDSPYSIFRVVYLCSIFALASVRNWPVCENSEVLKFNEKLFFVESRRYLCIDGSRNIYTDPTGTNNDCILRHEFLTNEYDIYYSDNYPSSLDRCQNSTRRSNDNHRKVTKSRQSHSSTSHSFKNANSAREHRRNSDPSSRWNTRKGSRMRACSSRWYLGVGGDHRLKVFVTSENRTKREMFFIQKWHYSNNASSPNRRILIDERREGVSLLTTTSSTTTSKSTSTLTTTTTTGQTAVRQDKKRADEQSHSSQARQEVLGGLLGDSRPAPSSHLVHNSSKSIPRFENTSATSSSSSSSSPLPSSSSSSSSSPLSSSSSSSSFSTTSPLKRTRSSFLNSLRHKKDKRTSCSNLLKLNCTQQQPSLDRDGENLAQDLESS